MSYAPYSADRIDQINALSTLMFLFSLSLVIGYYFIQKFQQKRLNGKNAESDLLKGVTL